MQCCAWPLENEQSQLSTLLDRPLPLGFVGSTPVQTFVGCVQAADFLADEAMVQELCSVLGERVFLPSPSPSSDGSDQLGNEQDTIFLLQESRGMLQESVWVSIFALVLAAISFCVTLVHTRRRDRDNRRPVLVFTYHREGWHIVSVGYGPALDVLFHRLVTAPGIQDNIRLPALSCDDKLKLKMCLHLPKQRFAATYRDMDGNEYSTRSQHDVSRTKHTRTMPRIR